MGKPIRGYERLRNWLDGYHLFILNDDNSVPMFDTLFDITAATSQAIEKIRGWRIEEWATTSDYNAIFFNYIEETPAQNSKWEKANRHNIKTIRWDIFDSTIEDRNSPLKI